MIVDRCDRSSFYMKSLTESNKNPTGVKDGSGCKVQQHYLHTIFFFLNVDNFHDNINSKVELNMWLPELTGRINAPLRQHEITGWSCYYPSSHVGFMQPPTPLRQHEIRLELCLLELIGQLSALTTQTPMSC